MLRPLVETSDRLWSASPSSATEPDTNAMANSISPVNASPTALMATARLACRRSPASSVKVSSGKLVAGSRTPLIRCVPLRMPAAAAMTKGFV